MRPKIPPLEEDLKDQVGDGSTDYVVAKGQHRLCFGLIIIIILLRVSIQMDLGFITRGGGHFTPSALSQRADGDLFKLFPTMLNWRSQNFNFMVPEILTSF